MSSTTPVETKPAAQAAAATALADPAAATAAKAKPWMIGLRQKYWLAGGVACGLALAGGVYGYKYFTAAPGRVIAQSEPPASVPSKAVEPPKLPSSVDELPSVIISPIRPVKDETAVPDIKVPDIKLPIEPDKVKPAPVPGATDTTGPSIVAPPIPSKPADTTKIDGPPPLILPLGDEKKKPEDPFKAPDSIVGDDKTKPEPLRMPAPKLTVVPDLKDAKPDSSVIRIGSTDAPPPAPPSPPKDDDIKPPPIPKIELGPTPAAPVPGKKDEAPPIPSIPEIGPIAPPPVVSPMPKVGAEPMIPTIALPGVKLPDPGPGPMIPAITIGDPPVPPIGPGPMPEVKKKDMYDEDWHTQRNGDTYPLISREYYKTADYAAALEAYNKDRRKSKDDVVRVPPTWVLEEQFPNLLNKPEKTAVPEVKPTGNIKFEAVAPTSGTRPAPAPLSRSNDEYRVTNPAGETIREIARKVYGDEKAWKKVYDQNPNIDPTQPIPSGTTLRVAK